MTAMDANTYEGALALRALYIIAHDIAHADGVEEERELRMVVKLVRQALGNHEFDATFIMQQYREHANRPLRPEELGKIGADYRAALLICAGRIAASDDKVTFDEGRMLENLAKRLDMPADWAVKMAKGMRGEELPQAEVIAIESICQQAWARGVLSVALDEADEDVIKLAADKLRARHDPATQEGKEEIKKIEAAVAILLGAEPDSEAVDRRKKSGSSD